MAQSHYNKKKFNYSMKNIPIPSRDEYLYQLIHSVEKFVRNLRWRAHFFLNPTQEQNKETYGFPSLKHPTALPELKLLEQRLMAMVRNVEFRSYSNEFQEVLKEDVRIKSLSETSGGEHTSSWILRKDRVKRHMGSHP